jgi:hypothetical protein
MLYGLNMVNWHIPVVLNSGEFIVNFLVQA